MIFTRLNTHIVDSTQLLILHEIQRALQVEYSIYDGCLDVDGLRDHPFEYGERSQIGFLAQGLARNDVTADLSIIQEFGVYEKENGSSKGRCDLYYKRVHVHHPDYPMYEVYIEAKKLKGTYTKNNLHETEEKETYKDAIAQLQEYFRYEKDFKDPHYFTVVEPVLLTVHFEYIEVPNREEIDLVKRSWIDYDPRINGYDYRILYYGLTERIMAVYGNTASAE